MIITALAQNYTLRLAINRSVGVGFCGACQRYEGTDEFLLKRPAIYIKDTLLEKEVRNEEAKKTIK